MSPIIENYRKAVLQVGYTWGTITIEPGWWLLAVHAINAGMFSDLESDPGFVEAGGRPWQLLTQADLGNGLPKIRVWARKILAEGTYTALFAGPAGMDVHSHFFAISGARDRDDVSDVFSVGLASSATGGTSQKVPHFSADEDTASYIGVWISGAVGNYTIDAGLGAQGELDGVASTSRAGFGTIGGIGPGSVTSTFSTAAPWAALTILTRPAAASGITFPASRLKMRTELALGANPGDDPARWAALWTDVSSDAQPRDGGITIKRGREDETSTSGPSSMTLTLDNTDGKYSRLNPLGPYYGSLRKNTPARLWVDAGAGWDLRYTGFISEFPPRSQGGQVDEHMPIVAAGVLRRLQQGEVLASPLFRAITAREGWSAYWPLETDGSSGLADGVPMRTTGPVSFGDGGPAGSGGAVSFDSTGAASGVIVGMPDVNGWWISWFLDIPVDFDGSTDVSPMVNWVTPGAAADQWFCYIPQGQGGKIALESFQLGVSENAVIGNTDLRGLGPVLITVAIQLNGSDVDMQVTYKTADGLLNNGTGTFYADAINPPTSIGLNGFMSAIDYPTPKGTISHLMAGAMANAQDIDSQQAWLLTASTGYTGESAADRVIRLGAEENVPVVVTGNDGLTEAMGPQPVDSFLNILRECETTDGGVVYELRDGRPAYQCRAARYNATATLALDYAAGHVAPPLEPTDDDQRTRNSWTASLPDGTAARVLDSASIDEVGLYDDSVTVNAASPDQLPHQAGWRVHLGTADDLRYPTITPNLNGRPDLIDTYVRLDIGHAAAITSPGRDLPPGRIDLMAEGYTETIDVVSWTPAINCSPGKPWRAATLGEEDTGRLDTAAAHLASSVSAPSPATPVTEDFEDATLNITITGGGNLGWSRTSDRAYAGSWSLKSGAITDNQTSDAIVTVPAGATACVFWYRVSSEDTFDFLRVLVDSTEKFAVSGESGWRRGAVACSGASSVTFRYSKDAFTAAGDDAAWIDEVMFTTTGTLSVATDGAGRLWSTQAADMGFAATMGGEEIIVVTVTGSSSPQTFTAVRAVNGISKSHAAGTDVRLDQPAILSL